MKKLILSVSFLMAASAVFSQSFMHGAGLSFLGSIGGNGFGYGGGLTYSPRFNFVETEKMSVSAGVPLTIGLLANIYTTTDATYGYTYDNTSVGLIINTPLIINLNMGRGSSKENSDRVGYFVGAGFGYQLGEYLVDETDSTGYYYNGSRSIGTYGPAANAGVRFGVGREHKNIEVKLSYMKMLNDRKQSQLGLSCLFNF
ncbi:MAG: hypothetical protein U0X40_00045 [Ferruginibacter sp.]